MRNTSDDGKPPRVLRCAAVLARTGLSRATLYRLIKKGSFPPGRQLSEGTVGWYEGDIEAWIKALFDDEPTE